MTIHHHALTAVAGLPVAALQQHLAILGKTGSGKTYAAKSLVEWLLAAGRRVCILDPTGAWWGLRSSADGASPGFGVTIFGGDHADVPINEHAGTPLGKLIGEENIPCVIDLTGTKIGERQRFATAFAEELYRVNRTPLHLIIDEADEFAPQSGPPGTERMLGAIDRIVRRGRIKGFRVLMISQRPAVLNKNALTQANTLIAMRLPSSQDRKAIELWIKGQADEDQATDVLGSLAGLKRGEGWVWSPEYGVLQRVGFPKIRTFDSGRTPDDGEAIAPPKSFADVDVSKISEAFAEAVSEAKANDPKALRAEIAALRDQLAAEKAKPAGGASVEELRAVSNMASALSMQIQSLRNCMCRIGELVRLATTPEPWHESAPRDLLPVRPSVLGSNGDLPPAPASPAVDHQHGAGARRVPPTAAPRPSAESTNGSSRTGPQQKLIDAIAWWINIGIARPTRHQAAHVAGYTPSGGTWRNLLGEARREGLIDYDGHCLVLQRLAAANWTEIAKTPAEIRARVLGKLAGPARKVMQAVLREFVVPVELGRTDVAERSGYEAEGGTFRNILGELRSLGLITYPKRTTVQAAKWLFDQPK